MKKFLSSIRISLVRVSCIVTAAVLIGACSKFNDDSDNNNNTPVANLMPFNLASDQPSVGITLSGSNLTYNPLAYNYTGVYQRIYIGKRAVESYNDNADSTIATTNFNFEANKYYSLFVAGANGNYTNIVTRDNFDSLSTSTR